MKKLSKVLINPENLVKDEELQKLRGGWQGFCAVYDDGKFIGLGEIYCNDDWYTWQCDQHCAQHFSADYCICNFPY